MSPPAVSAVITNHDYGEFLRDAVDSALAQEYAGRVEVIVVDDGSTDDSPAVLASYGDRIRVLRQTNRGQLRAFAAGLAAARGDIVCLLDADDAWTPDKVARVAEAFSASDAEWVTHALLLCDDRLRPLGPRLAPTGRLGPVPPRPLLFLERRAGVATSGVSLRRELAERLVAGIDAMDAEHARALRYDADRILFALIGRMRQTGWQTSAALGLYRRHGRQQFAGEDRAAALLDRQVEVDLVVAEVMRDGGGRMRVPSLVHKHRLVRAALTGEPGRWRHLARGLAAAGRILPEAPALAARQAAALAYAALAPRRWFRRVARRQGLGP